MVQKFFFPKPNVFESTAILHSAHLYRAHLCATTRWQTATLWGFVDARPECCGWLLACRSDITHGVWLRACWIRSAMTRDLMWRDVRTTHRITASLRSPTRRASVVRFHAEIPASRYAPFSSARAHGDFSQNLLILRSSGQTSSTWRLRLFPGTGSLLMSRAEPWAILPPFF